MNPDTKLPFKSFLSKTHLILVSITMKPEKKMKFVTLGHGSNPKLESKLDLPSNPRPNRMELQEIRKSGDEFVVIKFEIGVNVGVRARIVYQ